MIHLDTTSMVLRVVLGEAGTLGVETSYQEFVASTGSWYDFGSQQSTTNGTSAVDITAAPASGKKRRVEFISIVNDDTATHTVTIQKYNGSSTKKLFQATLQTGYSLIWDGHNFWVKTPLGEISSSGGGGSTVTKYSATFGDNSSTSFALTHALGSRDVDVTVRLAASPYTEVDVLWDATDSETVTIYGFDTAPGTSELRAVVMG